MNIFDLDLEDEFLDAFTTGGSPVTQCNCGREYVCIDNEHYFDGMEAVARDYYRAAEEDPNILLVADVDSVSIMDVMGIHFVAECECRGWEPYMRAMIHSHREIRIFQHAADQKLKQAIEHEKTFKRLKKD